MLFHILGFFTWMANVYLQAGGFILDELKHFSMWFCTIILLHISEPAESTALLLISCKDAKPPRDQYKSYSHALILGGFASLHELKIAKCSYTSFIAVEEDYVHSRISQGFNLKKIIRGLTVSC